MSAANNWKYYNNAILPTTEPHELPDLMPVEDGSIWKLWKGNTPLLVRWTSNFDCGCDTGWWFCIKDTPFDIKAINSKKRYEINKGNKVFSVETINPLCYQDELYHIQKAAFSSYPEKYRPIINEEEFKRSIHHWPENVIIFGAFLRENRKLCGFSYITEGIGSANFNVQRVIPEYEKAAVNAALIAGICEYYQDRLGNGFYICDGERNILHETNFQNYLEKYFGFRKAYCQLHILYRKPVGILIHVLMPFKKLLLKADGIGIIHKINAVLHMEEIRRQQKS